MYLIVTRSPGDNFVKGTEIRPQDYETWEELHEAIREVHQTLEAEYPSPEYHIMMVVADTMVTAAKVAKDYP